MNLTFSRRAAAYGSFSPLWKLGEGAVSGASSPSPVGLTADQMTRILQCHRSRVLLGEENAAAVADDPYLLPDAWVDIDVRSEDGNFAIVLSSDTVRLNLELLGRAKHYAHDHMVAIQPTIR